jgi:hypothetical protein
MDAAIEIVLHAWDDGYTSTTGTAIVNESVGRVLDGFAGNQNVALDPTRVNADALFVVCRSLLLCRTSSTCDVLVVGEYGVVG